MEDIIAKLLGTWASNITFGSILLRSIIALIFGAIIGCERATKRHAAGLRTFIVITLSACFATIIDVYLIERYNGTIPLLTGAILIGAAILSSNTILYSSRNQIKGLTTSVAMWGCCLVGVAVGAGLYTLSIIAFIILVISLSSLPPLEIYLKNRSNYFEIHLELENKNKLAEFIETVRRLGLKIDDIEANPAYNNSGLSVYTVSLTVVSRELKKYKTHSEIIQAISTIDYVNHVEEI